MKPFLLPFIITITSLISNAQHYPKEKWGSYKDLKNAGWSSEKLTQAKLFYDSLNSAGIIVIYEGKILINWGETERNFICHSMRKSFVSMLYGYYIENGTLDINDTLDKLGIDDIFELSEIEKTATIKNLLMSNSGVYHPAASEAPAMRYSKPKRNSHKPGEHWYYNNWGFNVLGNILEIKTGKSIYQSFEEVFAKPLHMEHYSIADSMYQYEDYYSKYPAYHFLLSAKDLARLGLLMLNYGDWKGDQILTKEWVSESTSLLSTPKGQYKVVGDYGYLWWISHDNRFNKYGMYSALGYGDHSIDILPVLDLVFVHRTDTFSPENRVRFKDRLKLLEMIIEARLE